MEQVEAAWKAKSNSRLRKTRLIIVNEISAYVANPLESLYKGKFVLDVALHNVIAFKVAWASGNTLLNTTNNIQSLLLLTSRDLSEIVDRDITVFGYALNANDQSGNTLSDVIGYATDHLDGDYSAENLNQIKYLQRMKDISSFDWRLNQLTSLAPVMAVNGIYQVQIHIDFYHYD